MCPRSTSDPEGGQPGSAPAADLAASIVHQEAPQFAMQVERARSAHGTIKTSIEDIVALIKAEPGRTADILLMCLHYAFASGVPVLLRPRRADSGPEKNS